MPAQPRADGSLVLLYIEDNAASVSVMEAVLELRPVWTFRHAGTVEAGLTLARARRPDLVLLDMNLPDGSGATALLALKADERTRTVPVVVLTAGTASTTAMTAAGAAAVWTKPHDLSRMLAYFDAVADGTQPSLPAGTQPG